MIRKNIIQGYIEEPLVRIVGHNYSIFLKSTFWMIIKLSIIFLLYLLSLELWDTIYNKRIAAGIGILLLGQYTLHFFNLYLDALVYTKKGLKIFTWESFLEYKMEVFDRDHIQVVSFEQKTLWDSLFMKGSLRISLMIGSDFTFENINNPQKEAKKMLGYKDKFESQSSHVLHKEKEEKDKEKFNILVETLGEIIQEYSVHGSRSKEDDE